MEEELDNLCIIDEKEDPFQAQEDGSELEEGYKQCLVGSYLTASVVHFPLMRNIMSNLWHPVRGISIIDISDKRCLFRFFYEGEFLPTMGDDGAIQYHIWLGYIIKSPVEKRGTNDESVDMNMD
ncbi:hypothetical protein Golob_004001 [Gossypium lobatum]|uniref:DUF4283 domain-containing protein n=1 Tax=Gossypium lobatum TaxID=34289 RepID=A0A7J8N023_9ROSI|nr:hypothetical protein [Gossypium lobatum]